MSGIVGGTQITLTLSRSSRVYAEGETISGSIKIQSSNEVRHDGIIVSLQGAVTTQPINPSGSGSSSGNSITLSDCLIQVVNPGKIPAGKTEIPFELTLESNNNNNSLEEEEHFVKLFETYHGVKVAIDYMIGAQIKRTGILASNIVTKGQEIFVITKNVDKSYSKKEDFRQNFEMTPETLREKKRKFQSGTEFRSKEVADFSVRGYLESTKCQITEPIVGKIIVEKSERPIKSLELQLIRVESVCADETTGPPTLRETSEVQSIQIGDGDVARNVEIPIFMILPRHFVCPSIKTNVFCIDFEINVTVIFNDNFVAAQNIPITLCR